MVKPEYNRICPHCGKEFTTTVKQKRYCSDNCAKRAYDDRKRQASEDKPVTRTPRPQRTRSKTKTVSIPTPVKEEVPTSKVKVIIDPNSKYLGVSAAAAYMGVTRQYVYYLIKHKHLDAHTVSQRKTLISVRAIEAFIKNNSYLTTDRRQMRANNDGPIVLDGEPPKSYKLYTSSEIAEKYHLKKPSTTLGFYKVYPKYRKGNTFYYMAKEVDSALCLSFEESKDWKTANELSERYNVPAQRIYDQANRKGISKRKVGGMLYFSLAEFDNLRNKIPEHEPYTFISYQDAMLLTKMNRNQLDYFIRKHKVKKRKHGKYTSVCREMLTEALTGSKHPTHPVKSR